MMTSRIAKICNLANQIFSYILQSSNQLTTLSEFRAAFVKFGSIRQTNNISMESTTFPLISDVLQFCQLGEFLQLIDGMRLHDVGLKPDGLSDVITGVSSGGDDLNSTSFIQPQAPTLYLHINENPIYSSGVFILRPGSRMPLHDHPDMCGIIKVLYGVLRCRSFTIDLEATEELNHLLNLMQFRKERDRSSVNTGASGFFVVRLSNVSILDAKSAPSVLYPSENNLHELQLIGNGGAAFFDILSPPYDHELGVRECHYYDEFDMDELFKSIDYDNGLAATVDVADAFHGTSLSSMTTMSREATKKQRTNTMHEQYVDNVSSSSFLNAHASVPSFQAALISRIKASNLVCLQAIPPPLDYWCDSVVYQGPALGHL